MAWKNYTVAQMKEVAVKYNKLHKIPGVAKLKRDELIKVLETITEFKGSKLHVKAIHGGEEIKVSGAPTITTEYKSKIELADLEKKSAMKKKIKAQAEGAKADAAAIKPPETPKPKKATLPKPKGKEFNYDKVAPQLNGEEVAYDGAFGTSTKPFVFDMKKIMVDALKRIKEQNINIKVKKIQSKINGTTIYNYAIPTDQEIFVWKGKPLFSYDKREDGWAFLILLDHKGKPIVPIAVNYRRSQAPHRPYVDAKRPSERLASDITLGKESGTGMTAVNITESEPFLEPNKLTEEEVKQFGEKDKKGELFYHKFFK